MEKLGRRAVAWKHWRWGKGALDLVSGSRVTDVNGDYVGWSRNERQPVVHRGRRIPDLTDPATLGCLLALLVGALGQLLADRVIAIAVGTHGWGTFRFAECIITNLEPAP